MMFTMVQVPSTYNAILGHPGMNQLDAVVSNKHLLICFPAVLEIDEMHRINCLADSATKWRLGIEAR